VGGGGGLGLIVIALLGWLVFGINPMTLLQMGGGGTGSSDRGYRPYLEWLQQNVGRWEYPNHVKVEAKR